MVRRRIFLLCVAMSTSVCQAVYTLAPYTGNNWSKVWNFNDGMQGWTPVVAGTGATQWTDAVGGGAMYFLNPGTGSYGHAQLNLTTLEAPFNNLGTNVGNHQPFVMQCDIIIPAYTGQGNVGGAHPGVLQGESLAAVRTGDLKGPAIGGGAGGSYGAQARDRSWDGTNRTLGYTFGLNGQVHTWTTMKLQLSYCYLGEANTWNAWVYNPLPSDRDPNPAGAWMQVASARQASANGDVFQLLSIGGNGFNAQTPWGDCYIDNVKLLVPEPATLTLLLLGLWGVCRRRPG